MSAATILGDSDSDVAQAAELLRKGHLVALPTETVYGLAGNAFSETTVREIFTVKGRPLIDPLIVHIHTWEQVEVLASGIPDSARKLAEAFWPGPLTLILPKADAVPELVTAGNPTVAVRMPAHPLTRRILQAANTPVAAPSANPFGYISPTCAEHVQTSLGERLDWIVDGGHCQSGIESTIVDLSNTVPVILRPGPISPESIAKSLGIAEVSVKQSHANTDDTVEAPGMLTRHYSPNTALILLEHSERPPNAPNGKSAWVTITRQQVDAAPTGYDRYWFSDTGDLNEMAHTLFAMLRKLDSAGYECIHLELPAARGIGIAIRDRLSRAAGQSA